MAGLAPQIVFSPRARDAQTKMVALSRENFRAEPSSADLLIGLWYVDRSIVEALLTDLEDFEKGPKKDLEKDLVNAIRSVEPSIIDPGWAKISQQARVEALNWNGEGRVDTVHMLLALASFPGSVAMQALARLDITPHLIRTAVELMLRVFPDRAGAKA